MPLHQTIAAFAAALLLAFAAAAFRPRLRADLRRLRLWAGLAALACLLSAASAFFAERDHAGTGFVTRHGWPKPFRFDFVSEAGERSTSFETLYFAGNLLAWAAALLLFWTLFRTATRQTVD